MKEEPSNRLPDIIFRWEKQSFTQIPNEMLRDPKMSAKAKGLLCLLLSNKEGWYSYMETIQSMMSDGRASIQSGIKELEEQGYLLKLRYRAVSGKKPYKGSIWGCTSEKGMFDLEYIKKTVEKAGFELEIPCKYTPLVSTTRLSTCGLSTSRLSTCRFQAPNNTNSKNINFKNTNSSSVANHTKEKEIKSSPPVKDRFITPSMFEKFWSLYPKKVDKGKAKTKWSQLCKKPDRPTWLTIKSAIEAQKKSARWQDSKFIPHPTTWLNQQRWLDDPAEMIDYGEINNKITTPSNQNKQTIEEIIEDQFRHSHLKRVFIAECCNPAISIFHSREIEKESLIRAIIRLYESIDDTQKQKVPISTRALLPSPMVIVSDYLAWIEDNDWISSRDSKLLDISHPLFKRFCREAARQDNMERNPVTGYSYLQDGGI